ncbi:MAG: hypothetical protein ACR5KV_04240 [Wolbachia sp.]
MLSIQEKYNTFKESTHFARLKDGGRFAIYALGIYLAVTFIIGCLGLIIRSTLLTLSLAILIFHPVAWILMKIVLTMTYKMAVEPLFHLIKSHVDEKEASKEKESNAKTGELLKSSEQEQTASNQVSLKTSDGDSGIVPDSEPVLGNSSRKSSIASEDSGLSSKEFHEDLQTLVHQTNRGHYAYWLQQYDIAHIARIKCKYSEGFTDGVFFCIPGNLDSLNERLKEYKNKVEQENLKVTFTSVVNLGNLHWTTLVVTYNLDNKQFSAYYCDSFSAKLPSPGSKYSSIKLANEIKELVVPLTNQASELNVQGKKEMSKDVQKTVQTCRDKKNELVGVPIDTDNMVSALEAILEIKSDNIRSSKTEQQNDGWNCGIFALENAHRITQMINEGKSLDEIDKKLLEKFDLNKKREEFSRVLMEDDEWKEAIAEGGILHDTLQQLTLKDSKKEETQSITSSFIRGVMIEAYNSVKNAFSSN